MIARNYLKHPEALAVQLCLDFGAILRWATARPGSRVLRAIRAQRAKAIRMQHVVPPWFPPLCEQPEATLPAWVKKHAQQSRQLAKAVQTACRTLFAEEKGLMKRIGRPGPPRWTLIGFKYA